MLLFCFIGVQIAVAKEYSITTAADLEALDLKPGDKVVMEEGDWSGQNLVFKGHGTKTLPIYLSARTAGKIHLKGRSTLLIDGTWLVAEGLTFTDGFTAKEHVITFSERSANCRLTNSAIMDYNHPQTKSIFNFWILVQGTQNRIDHCFLKGKTTRGTVIGVNISGEPNYHRIDHNYFGPRPDVQANGGEIIRIGTDIWSMHDSYTVVENNIFEHCDGEIEIVSNKSGHNTIRNNLFYESRGTLTLRHGNFARVYGNFFIGNGVKETGGIRVVGENHKIYDNYFSGLTGTGLRAVISVMNAWKNPPLHGYWQVKNLEVTGNTIINCKEVFVIGAGKDEKTFIPPENIKISANTLLKNGSLVNWMEKNATVEFRNNTAYKTISKAILPDGITNKKPQMRHLKNEREILNAFGSQSIGVSWINGGTYIHRSDR